MFFLLFNQLLTIFFFRAHLKHLRQSKQFMTQPTFSSASLLKKPKVFPFTTFVTLTSNHSVFSSLTRTAAAGLKLNFPMTASSFWFQLTTIPISCWTLLPASCTQGWLAMCQSLDPINGILATLVFRRMDGLCFLDQATKRCIFGI